MTKEGSLKAPIRHSLSWDDPSFFDQEELEKETRRIFDICHGCRRCFNLCDSFPRLFDLIDNSPTGELDSVEKDQWTGVNEACTLCDMCFMTKCPYVPPHEFNLDFPHLMLRQRIVARHEGKKSFMEDQLAETDRNGRLATLMPRLTNWALKEGSPLRPAMEKIGGIHQEAKLPSYSYETLLAQVKKSPLSPNTQGNAFGEKVVFYGTCYGNYNKPSIGTAGRALLSHHGVEVEVIYPECCGMPHLEKGQVENTVQKAQRISQELLQWIQKGYKVIALIPSCALMIKQEWPLLVKDPDILKVVQEVAKHTYDLCQYVVWLHKTYDISQGLKPLGQGITLHISCHSRAQNMGQKAVEMLRLIPDTEVAIIERCSGHGGSWGVSVDHFETAIKVGKPVARKALQEGNHLILSECPLAAEHILQGIERLEHAQGEGEGFTFTTAHPIEILAKAYGV